MLGSRAITRRRSGAGGARGVGRGGSGRVHSRRARKASGKRVKDEVVVSNGFELARNILERTGLQARPLLKLNREAEWIELKTTCWAPPDNSKGELQDCGTWSVTKAIVSLRNTHGGIVLLGVDDDGNPVDLTLLAEKGKGTDRDSILEALKHAITPKKKAHWRSNVERFGQTGATQVTWTADLGNPPTWYQWWHCTLDGKPVVAVLVEPAPDAPLWVTKNQKSPCLLVRHGEALGAKAEVVYEPHTEIVENFYRSRSEAERRKTSSWYAAKWNAFREMHRENFEPRPIVREAKLWLDRKEAWTLAERNFFSVESAVMMVEGRPSDMVEGFVDRVCQHFLTTHPTTTPAPDFRTELPGPLHSQRSADALAAAFYQHLAQMREESAILVRLKLPAMLDTLADERFDAICGMLERARHGLPGIVPNARRFHLCLAGEYKAAWNTKCKEWFRSKRLRNAVWALGTAVGARVSFPPLVYPKPNDVAHALDQPGREHLAKDPDVISRIECGNFVYLCKAIDDVRER
jgi:hypothetical protein